jgi:hypothetical protein
MVGFFGKDFKGKGRVLIKVISGIYLETMRGVSCSITICVFIIETIGDLIAHLLFP